MAKSVTIRNAKFDHAKDILSPAIQNSDEIHALFGKVSMATHGAVSIKGGNFQIFEHFLNRSGATVHLGTRVR